MGSFFQIPGFRERTPSVIREPRPSSEHHLTARERTPSAVRALRPRYQRNNEWDPIQTSQGGSVYSAAPSTTSVASNQTPGNEEVTEKSLSITSQGSHEDNSRAPSTTSIASNKTPQNDGTPAEVTSITSQGSHELSSPTRSTSQPPSTYKSSPSPETRGRHRRRGFRPRTPSAIRAIRGDSRQGSCTRPQTPSPIRAIKPKSRRFWRKEPTYSVETSRERSLSPPVRSFV